jgi:hypothetical protein
LFSSVCCPNNSITRSLLPHSLSLEAVLPESSSHADAAATALRRAAKQLRDSLDERSRAIKQTMGEWRDKHRETFDADMRQLWGQAQDLAQRYEAAAGKIDTASDKATAEQARRNSKRKEEEERRKLG